MGTTCLNCSHPVQCERPVIRRLSKTVVKQHHTRLFSRDMTIGCFASMPCNLSFVLAVQAGGLVNAADPRDKLGDPSDLHQEMASGSGGRVQRASAHPVPPPPPLHQGPSKGGHQVSPLPCPKSPVRCCIQDSPQLLYHFQQLITHTLHSTECMHLVTGSQIRLVSTWTCVPVYSPAMLLP